MSNQITVDALMQAAADGVLRALATHSSKATAPVSAADLVRAGFSVECQIRVGGIPRPYLNPQPEPPSPSSAG